MRPRLTAYFYPAYTQDSLPAMELSGALLLLRRYCFEPASLGGASRGQKEVRYRFPTAGRQVRLSREGVPANGESGLFAELRLFI